jgi:hypothetical protein
MKASIASIGSAARIAALLLASSCMSSSAPASDARELSDLDSGSQLTLSLGQQIDVTLQVIGPYNYGDPVISSDAMHFLAVDLQQPPNPGGPTPVYRFEAASAGTTTIHIPYSGPHAGFDLTVTVEP